MNHLFKISFIVFLSLFIGNQLSAQTNCSNIANPSRINTGNNHVFGGDSFGQSIVADASCMPGNTFSEFSFWSQGNSPTKFDLAIYDGETATGTPRYTQPDITHPPTNFGGIINIPLGSGSGDLSFVDGSTYTFIMTMASSGGGNLIAHTSPNATAGRAYLKGSFYNNADLIFEIGAITTVVIVDTDNDGIADDVDPDDDNDGCLDGVDSDPLVAGIDSDNDGIADECDNCPTTSNANQADANNNGIGDVCESTPPPPPPAPNSTFTLRDASGAEITQGSTICPGEMYIVANMDMPGVESVRFGFKKPSDAAINANFKVESFAPYSLSGDQAHLGGGYNTYNFTPGTYTVTATPYSKKRAKGTKGTKETLTFTVGTPCRVGGINEALTINIYPNPAHNKVTIDLDKMSSGELNIGVYNTSGVLVRSQLVETALGSHSQTISLLDLPNGLYIVKVSNKEQSITGKVMKF